MKRPHFTSIQWYRQLIIWNKCALHCTALHRSALHLPALHSIAMTCTELHCTALQPILALLRNNLEKLQFEGSANQTVFQEQTKTSAEQSGDRAEILTEQGNQEYYDICFTWVTSHNKIEIWKYIIYIKVHFAKLWLVRPLIKNIPDSSHQYGSNVTFGVVFKNSTNIKGPYYVQLVHNCLDNTSIHD